MKKILVFFRCELKRLCLVRYFIIGLVILALCQAVLKIGIDDYKAALVMADKFTIIEQKNFEKHKSYSFYGDEGINLLFVPAPESILVRNTAVPKDLLANIDTKVTTRIYSLYKGKSLFRRSLWGPFGLADILLLVGSLMAIFFGFGALRNREFLRSLASLAGPGRVYFYVISSRLLIMAILLALLFFSFCVSLMIHHVHFTAAGFGNFANLIGLTYIQLVFFFFIGVLTGLLVKSMHAAVLVVVAAWFSLSFLLPGVVNHIIEKNSISSARDLETEIEKMGKVLNFEERCFSKKGEFDINDIETERRFIEEYWENDYPKIEAQEKCLRDEIQKDNDTARLVSSFIPPAFYLLVAEEVGSRGLDSFIAFYDYCMQSQRLFLRFWIDRVYYYDPSVLVNFIKDKENLYFSQSRLPRGFHSAVLVSLAYIFIFMFLTYLAFIKSLTAVRLSPGEIDLQAAFREELHFKKGEHRVLNLNWDGFKDVLYNLLSGRHMKSLQRRLAVTENLDSVICIDDINIACEANRENFFYICGSEDIPGEFKIKDLFTLFPGITDQPAQEPGGYEVAGIKKEIRLVPGEKDMMKKRFKKLTKMEKAKIMLALTQTVSRNIYIINEVIHSPSPAIYIEVKRQLEKLSSDGALVLLLTPWYNTLIPLKITNSCCNDVTAYWLTLINAIEKAANRDDKDK